MSKARRTERQLSVGRMYYIFHPCTALRIVWYSRRQSVTIGEYQGVKNEISSCTAGDRSSHQELSNSRRPCASKSSCVTSTRGHRKISGCNNSKGIVIVQQLDDGTNRTGMYRTVRTQGSPWRYRINEQPGSSSPAMLSFNVTYHVSDSR